VVQHATCFLSTDRGVTSTISAKPGEESDHLDLQKVMTMHISTDIGAELPKTCSQFARRFQFDQNVPQNDLLSVSHL